MQVEVAQVSIPSLYVSLYFEKEYTEHIRFFKKYAFGGVFNKKYGECWCRSVGADGSEASLP